MNRRAAQYHPALMTDMYHPDSAYVSWRTGLNGLTTFDLYTRVAPFGGARRTGEYTLYRRNSRVAGRLHRFS